MKIGNVETAPLAAVLGVSEHGGRDESPRTRPAAVEGTSKVAAEQGEAPPPEGRVSKPVTLPEFPHYELSFRLDEERRRVVVQVIDAKTGTIVRSVPPDELGRVLRRLPDPRGVLLDRHG